MKLEELIIAVKEQGLTKTQLESYSDSLTSLYADMNLEMAEIEKQQALFWVAKKYQGEVKATNVEVDHAWDVTDKGLRQIVLKRYIKATEKLLSSVKHRIYSTY